MNYKESIQKIHEKLLNDSEDTIIIGQGLNDKNALWGSMAGLKSSFPDRVIDPPIAEDSIAGICVGLSLNGMYPINTHIRADFSLLFYNQLINLIAKYRYMFGGQFELPMLFRLIIGRSWGQGAQHSQSLQATLSHIPGLTIIMPSNPTTLFYSYKYARNNYKNPIISFEHRLLFETNFDVDGRFNKEKPLNSYIVRDGKHITILATSVMVLEAIRAHEYLKDYGIEAEVIDIHNVSHIDENLILSSIKKTGLLVVADTSWTHYGVAAEISRIILEKDHTILRKNQINLGMAFSSCPTGKTLEDLFYNDMHDIVEAVLSLTGETKKPVTKKKSMIEFYRNFKGPF